MRALVKKLDKEEFKHFVEEFGGRDAAHVSSS